MNADAITNQIIDRLRDEPLISKHSTGAIRSIIFKAVDSIISGLTPPKWHPHFEGTCANPAECCRELSRVWYALGIDHYNGKSASENVWELRKGRSRAESHATNRVVDSCGALVGQYGAGFTCNRPRGHEGDHAPYRASDNVQPDGRGVPTEQYTEGAPRQDAASLLTIARGQIAELQRVIDDMRRDREYESELIAKLPVCGHCPLLKSSKTRSDRPVASTTESPASAPACGPERVADSGQVYCWIPPQPYDDTPRVGKPVPEPAHICHWPNCASAELADEKIASLTGQLNLANARLDCAQREQRSIDHTNSVKSQIRRESFRRLSDAVDNLKGAL